MGKQKPNPIRVDPNAEFKRRAVAAVNSPAFPRNYRDIVFKWFPQYNTPANRKHLSNVVIGSSPDYKLTLILEAIAAGRLTLFTGPVEYEIIEQ